MPNLPKPRLRRSARARVDALPTAPSPEHDGLRWINIERPSPVDRAWLEEHFEFHPLDYEDVGSRNQRPKIDVYPDYLFIVLHFPVFDRAVGRLNAAELDIFVGPDYLITIPNTPLPPVEYLFERCRSSEELRENLLSKGSGYLLYRIVDASERIWDVLENYKEVVEALESTNESVISHRVNDTVRVLTAFSVVMLPLTLIASIWGMNVGLPGEHRIAAFWVIVSCMVVILVGMLAFFRRRGWL